MRKILTLASMFALVLMFALTAFATDPGPNWSDINDFVPAAGLLRTGNVGITEDITTGGYPASTDAGPYAIGYVGHSSDTYCNTDRHIVFYNWVSVAQWMRVVATNIDRHIMIRKPGTYTFNEKPMTVRIASNGEVLVTFELLYGENWDAKWYEYSFYPGKNPPTIWDKTYPQLAIELVNQIPVQKKYETTIVPSGSGVVSSSPTSGFQDAPAQGAVFPIGLGSGAVPSTGLAGNLLFLNSEALHHLNSPDVGFYMQFQEIVAPCNTTGDYVLKARMVFQCVNQMWYINPVTGAIDGTRSSTLIPPQAYPAP